MVDSSKSALPPENQFSSQSPRLLSEIAYERIKDAIRNADFEPGQPLSEQKLSKLLGISRTPVREAIHQLAQEGLLQIIPGRAVTVASLSVQEVINAVHIRSILEPEVARLVAASISQEEIENLKEIIKAMSKALDEDNRSAWVKADSKFHEILSRSCPNKLLGEMTLQVRNRVSYLATDNHTSHQRMIDCTEEHRKVVEAIAAGDPQAAGQAMREHINLLRESYFQRLTHLRTG
jgi:DNA-binding GntR family transcriptional regulator